MSSASSSRRVAAFLLSIVLSGAIGACSSMGKDFDRPSAGSLQLGQATVADVVARFGQPEGRTVKIGDAAPDGMADAAGRPAGLLPATVPGEVQSLRYLHIQSNAVGTLLIGSFVPTVTSHRALTLTFWNGRLISYAFDSSFDKDTTAFDESKVRGFVRGQTTRSEVIGQIGMPGGEGIYPRVAHQGTRVLTYQYDRPMLSLPSSTGRSMQSKSLELLFDSSDKLLEFYTTRSNEIL